MIYELNEFNRGSDHSSIISEVDRKNMVGKSKVQSPQRYSKRVSYKPLSFRSISFDSLFKRDEFVINVPVGDYICTIAFKGVMDHLKDVLKKQPKPNVTLQSVIKALNQAIDDTDLLVDCTCPDFVYRFSFWATEYGYKYGKPETRPSKITNPKDKLGAMCKHLISVLANKKWLVKVASVINEFIKAYPDDIQQLLGLSDDEFIVNNPKRTKRNADRINKNKSNRLNTLAVIDDPEPEELEPIDIEDSDENEEDESED